jgi:hypothetical protein
MKIKPMSQFQNSTTTTQHVNSKIINSTKSLKLTEFLTGAIREKKEIKEIQIGRKRSNYSYLQMI